LLSILFFWSLPVLAQVYEAWVATYNGPGNDGDNARALAVDDSGNVYVTGHSWSGGTITDYATIKYAPNGDILWARSYNGSGNTYDEAVALAVDYSGNVYVTGYSWDSGTYEDYATIKYSSAGETLWVRRYNGPGNSYDRPNALGVDDSGNVYVTGWSGIFPNYDYATIKYASNGDTLWVTHYNGPGDEWDEATALAVDDSGNVYVTGFSHGGSTAWDYATIKYSPSGDTLWVRRYNGPGNGLDVANELAVDDSGYVYVTGNSGTIKYSASGDSLWFGAYGGNDLDIDDSGNVYVTGYTYGGDASVDDYATIKYSPAGDTLWVRRYNGPGNNTDQANALAVDGSGNVYVTGVSYGGGSTLSDYATIKYSPSGDTLWVRRYNGPGNGYDQANALAVDDSGNVYVTGYSAQSSTYPYNYDYATIKYSVCPAKAGDANGDGSVNLTDIVFEVNYIFKGAPTPSPLCSGDVDGSGTSGDLEDIFYLINYVFHGGPSPIKIGVCCL